MTGLADCNNFFVSCERSVNPSLEGKAVVVMSNNDGCIVARSNEAKAMGIKMGQPSFEVRDLIHSGKLIAISGHHLLYREISIEIHKILQKYVPATIDYSVDEAFLNLDGIPTTEISKIANEICETCWKEKHIPITIGISRTKTLAKLITETCKKRGWSVGIITDFQEIYEIIRDMPISELWGVGRRLTKKLYQDGIFSIADFAAKDRFWVKSRYGINIERTWLELHGIDCIDLNHVGRKIQDSISETRTFPSDIAEYDYLRSRIAIYGADCAKRLRLMNARCQSVSTFLRTNRFHAEQGIYCPEVTIKLPNPTDITSEIVCAAILGLGKIYSPTLLYKRAGVVLTDITPKTIMSSSLFDASTENFPTTTKDKSLLMKVFDNLNRNLSHPVIKLASQLTKGHPCNNDGYSSSFQCPAEKTPFNTEKNIPSETF